MDHSSYSSSVSRDLELRFLCSRCGEGVESGIASDWERVTTASFFFCPWMEREGGGIVNSSIADSTTIGTLRSTTIQSLNSKPGKRSCPQHRPSMTCGTRPQPSWQLPWIVRALGAMFVVLNSVNTFSVAFYNQENLSTYPCCTSGVYKYKCDCVQSLDPVALVR